MRHLTRDTCHYRGLEKTSPREEAENKFQLARVSTIQDGGSGDRFGEHSFADLTCSAKIDIIDYICN